LDVERGCDKLVTSLVVNVDGLRPSQAAAYRVTQTDERRE
jgi:hypothetical protein